jgi:predicted outer membrane repeat protein
MFNNKLISSAVLFCFICLFMSLSSVSGADFDDVRDSIANANSGGVITLSNTTYYGDGAGVFITKNITLQGPSGQFATLDAKGESRVVGTDNDTVVTFRRIIFKNGFLFGSGSGSGIRAHGRVIIDNCTFINNEGESGTAVFLSQNSANSRISNCLFIENKGIYEAADNWIEGGAIDVHVNNVNITNCVFNNNQANNSGGAISFVGNTNGHRLINCSFTNNNADMGGAVRIVNTGVLIQNCRFTSNFASGSGGAIYIRDSKVIIENSFFEQNIAAGNGGGIYNGFLNNSIISYLNISSSVFKSNNALSGGVIHSNSSINIKNSNFTANWATNNGGVLYLLNARLLLNTSKFLNNSATNGGVISSSNSNLTVKYNYMFNNTANRQVQITGVTKSDLSSNWWGDNDNPLNKHVTDINDMVLSDYYTVRIRLNSINGNLATFSYSLVLNGTEITTGSSNLPVFYGNYYNGTNYGNFQVNTQGTINAVLNNEKLFKVTVDGFTAYLVVFVNDEYGDDFYSGSSWESSLKSLKKAVELVVNGGWIYIASSTYSGVNNTNVIVNKDVNIVGGDNVVFDGENAFIYS